MPKRPLSIMIMDVPVGTVHNLNKQGVSDRSGFALLAAGEG
ncbi:hypothetical protein B4113_3749 [Geobacillus sp. B4113_201601]|nr:hypothetical protein B4113_3749 [Geobacillus sp. B4113_201601]